MKNDDAHLKFEVFGFAKGEAKGQFAIVALCLILSLTLFAVALGLR